MRLLLRRMTKFAARQQKSSKNRMDDMQFWKEHTALRLILMLVTFVLGLFLLIYGWKQTGQLGGLGLMLVGVALLLVTLALYNKPFEDPKKR